MNPLGKGFKGVELVEPAEIRIFTSVDIDIPVGTVVWSPFPDPLYNLDMEQKNRIRITSNPDGSYTLVFLLIGWDKGKETETEARKLHFQDKTEFLKFKESTIQALNQFQ